MIAEVNTLHNIKCQSIFICRLQKASMVHFQLKFHPFSIDHYVEEGSVDIL